MNNRLLIKPYTINSVWRKLFELNLTRHNLFVAVSLLLCLTATGCQNEKVYMPVANYYYVNPLKDLGSLGRVAVVEVSNNSDYPEMSVDITEALFRALQKQQVFGLTIVLQNDPAWRSLLLEPESTYSLNQIGSIRETLNCDGVLLGTITEFKPYPHMVLGLRLRLLDLRDGELLWALEQIWDITDKTTEYRIKDYYKTQKKDDSRLNRQLAVVSPIEFIRFVSYEVAKTL